VSVHDDIAAPRRHGSLLLLAALLFASHATSLVAQEPPPPPDAPPRERVPTAARPTPNADNESDDSDRRPLNRKTATAELPGGAKVNVSFGVPKFAGREYTEMESVAEGKVVRFFDSAAIKLATDRDLLFGETRIRKANVAPGYPGVYSLWLQRTGNGWRLVFNEKADVWGTQHEPAADVASVPLQHTRVDGMTPELAVKLQASAQGDGSWLLVFHWGEHRWDAQFRVAQ
jgi:hypothetical protein